MAPTRIMFIRHAEKPGQPANGGDGVTVDGKQDDESLTVRGWQRAGALAKFFSSQPPMRPNIIFAAGVGHGSKSERPSETVTPLAQLLDIFETDSFVTTHLKSDLQQLIDDVMSSKGIVLVAWQHELIPNLVGLLPNAPDVPQKWPGDRFDMVWVFDPAGTGWAFSQVPQLLLVGDVKTPIS
jgi:hypothetical protein